MLSAVLAVLACDRRQSSAPSQGGSTTGPNGDAAALAVELTPITPLLPRLRTHVAVDLRGNIYWIQESEPAPAGGDLVFVMGSSGVPQTIPALGVARLLEALGEQGRGGNGSIRSIAIGPDENLYVLFAGGNGPTPLWGLFLYAPAQNRVKLLADTKQLMEASQMGASLELAHGSLVSNAKTLWVWLRHTDAAAILRLVTIEGGGGGGGAGGSDVELRRLRIKPPKDVGIPNSEREDLCAGQDGSLYYIDREHAMLWRIDPAAGGEYAPLQSLDGLSRALAVSALEEAGQLCVLAGDDAPLVSHGYVPPGQSPPARASVTWAELSYPVLLELRAAADALQAPVAITREGFRALPALRVQELQPRGLLLDRATGTLITFDAASGELLRLKVVRK
jgi:hypothetical protein